MLEQLQACYPEYDRGQSDPFEGIKTGSINCLGSTLAAYAFDPKLIPLRYTLSRVRSETRERSVGGSHFLALRPYYATVLTSFTPDTERPHPIDEIGIDEYVFQNDLFTHPELIQRILTLIAQDPTSTGKLNVLVPGLGEPLIRIARIDPGKATQRVSNKGNLRDLRCKIETATSHLLPQPA
jgi:hypothetical protein